MHGGNYRTSDGKSLRGVGYWLASNKEGSRCSTRGGSQGPCIMFASTVQIGQPTLALKLREDITRNLKQEYQHKELVPPNPPKKLGNSGTTNHRSNYSER